MGKGVIFVAFLFLIVCIAGSVMAGYVDFANTRLTVALTAVGTTVTVSSTRGFPEVGIIEIGKERIAYSNTTATTFTGGGVLGLTNPLLRGSQGTEAVTHATGAQVRTPAGGMFNQQMQYSLAVLSDSAGLQAFFAKPTAALQLLGSFFFLPLQFFGTDLQILGIVWSVVGIGMLVAFFISMAGGRRV